MAAAEPDFRLGKLIRFVAGIATLVVLVQFAMDGGPGELLRQLGGIRPPGWLVLSAITLVNAALLAGLFRIAIRVVGVTLPFDVAFAYSAMNSYFNTILPMKGGIWVRGVYLKQRYGVSWTKYLFVLATGQLIQLALLAAIAIGLVLYGRLPLHLPALPGPVIIAAIAAALAAVLALALLRRDATVQFAAKARRGLQLWTADRLQLVHYVGQTLLMQALAGLRLWLAFGYVGTPLSLIEIAVLYAALAAGMSWAVTPGNIGVKEAAIVVLAVIIGVDADAAVAASIVDRIASLIITVVVGGYCAYRVSSSTADR